MVHFLMSRKRAASKVGAGNVQCAINALQVVATAAQIGSEETEFG